MSLGSSKPAVALNAQQSERYRAATLLLQQRKPEPAAELARQLTRDLPSSPDAQQLLAMCLADAGQHDAATAAFERALSLSQGHPLIVSNFASFLRKQGQHARAIDLLSPLISTSRGLMTPALRAKVCFDLGQSARALRRFHQAIDMWQRAVAQDPAHNAAMLALAELYRDLEELKLAEQSYRAVLALRPDAIAARTGLALTYRARGRADLALQSLSDGVQNAAQELVRIGALVETADVEGAITAAHQLVHSAPDYAPAYQALGELLWQHHQAAIPAFEQQMQRRLDDPSLRLVWIRFLLATKQLDGALAQIRLLRQQADGIFAMGLEASTLDALEQGDAAQALYAAAYQQGGKAQLDFLNDYARHLLKTRRFDAAADIALSATNRAPHDQLAWAYLSTAWRVLDDPRAHLLCDFERFVVQFPLDTPSAFNNKAEFLDTLAAELLALHNARRAPLEQSVRGGYQTHGRLFGRPIPVLESLQEVLRHSILKWLRAFSNDTQRSSIGASPHPFLHRINTTFNFGGSWSVRLNAADQGHHVSHVHQDGWLSSAMHVLVPECVRNNDAQAGHLLLGQPPADLGLNLPAQRVIRPEAGSLVLFPSYFWHGTKPFGAATAESPNATEGNVRLSLAFDMVPGLGKS